MAGTKQAGDDRFKARLVPLGWEQRHGTDRAIVVTKDKFGHSRNSALDQVELKSTKLLWQTVRKQLCKVSTYSSQ